MHVSVGASTVSTLVLTRAHPHVHGCVRGSAWARVLAGWRVCLPWNAAKDSMESTLLPAADRLRHRRQDDVSCIFSSHSAMMLCGGRALSPRPRLGAAPTPAR